MATLKSFLKMTGSLSGLVIYERNGQFFVKGAGGADKKRILSDPNFERTRENMREFGAAAVLGKTFRQGFLPHSKAIRTGSLSGKVTGMMKRINKAGAGERGERSFDIVRHRNFIEGFELNQKKSFSSVFYPPYPSPDINAERNQVTWEIPDFHPGMYMNSPEEATHFQLILHVFGLSNYVFEKSSQAYVFLHEQHNELRQSMSSDLLSLKANLNEQIELIVDLPVEPNLPETAALIVSLGLLFYQEINGNMYMIPGQNVMKVVSVK
ncbi:MAG: hypothetical protein WBN16_01735 [Lutimonas sp.]